MSIWTAASSRRATTLDTAPLHTALLDVEPLDTDGRLLRLHCHQTGHRAVARSTLSFGAVTVELDVLAASHRVTVRPTHDRSSNAEWQIDETVACATNAAAVESGALPPVYTWRTGPWHLAFESTLERGSEMVETSAADLAARHGEPNHLIVAFPGHHHALTGLQVAGSPDSLTWRTWHLYPGDDPHVVLTTTHATRASKGIAA